MQHQKLKQKIFNLGCCQASHLTTLNPSQLGCLLKATCKGRERNYEIKMKDFDWSLDRSWQEQPCLSIPKHRKHIRPLVMNLKLVKPRIKPNIFIFQRMTFRYSKTLIKSFFNQSSCDMSKRSGYIYNVVLLLQWMAINVQWLLYYK